MNNPQDIKEVIFYCKDCEEVVDTVRCGRKFVYKCKKCGTKNVAFGSEKSIRGFFRMEEGGREEVVPENAESKTVKGEEAKKDSKEKKGE